MPPLTVKDYQIGWICALNEEMSAAMAMLDEEYDMLAEQDPQDHNSYVLGRIHQHHIVIACMPEGVDGLVPVAIVAKDMVRTFPALRFGLMVGIGGGIPDLSNDIDIRLGDVVVSKPDKTSGGVVQYDKGKAESGGDFVIKGQLNQPPSLLLNTVTHLRARHGMRPSKMSDYMKEAIKRNPMMEETGFTFPSEPDYLYCGDCDRDIESVATDCQRFHGMRKQRKTNHPVAHYGLIASGNQVVKDAAVRDRLQAEFGALCAEMEAAGLMNEFPCLVIRGICDYADRRKNDAWHPYAAMTAAAYAKELLSYISRAQANQEKPLGQIIGLMTGLHQTSEKHLQATEAQTLQLQIHHESDIYRKCHQTFKVGPYEEQKNINPSRAPGTCKWVLNHAQYCRWRGTLRDDLIWISADPGCGKSVLAKFLVDEELGNMDDQTICYFFFKDIEEQDNLSVALCAILHQLFTHRPQLIRHAVDIHESSGGKITRDLSDLWRIWLAAARDPEAQNVTCVLDALDECREDDRRHLINMLVTFYNDISTAPGRNGRLKILVTCRPYDDIQYHFGKIAKDLPLIRLRGEDENDAIHDEIDSVICLKVREIAAEFKLTQAAVEQVEAKILNMEHRTYLWLYFAIGNIRDTYRNSFHPNRVNIDSLPSSVEAAYEGILNKIAQSQRPTAIRILEIIVGARRPLTVGEMALALGASEIFPDSSLLANDSIDASHLERQIRVWCGLFIFVNHSRIYLIHQTAKEFLLKSSERDSVGVYQWKHFLDPVVVEKNMALICVRFLLLNDIVKSGREASIQWTRMPYHDKKPVLHGDFGTFFEYSSEYWPSHLRNAHIRDGVFIQNLSPLYDPDSLAFRLWFPLYWDATEEDKRLPSMNNIRLASLLGHEEVLKFVLENEQHRIDEPDHFGCTALYWASRFGNTQIVQILLARGATVYPEFDEVNDDVQPLYAAAEEGHLGTVATLLENGDQLNGPKAAMHKANALRTAALFGHIEIVKTLLKNGADVKSSDSGGWTALHSAASTNQHHQMVKMLIESGADVDACSDDRVTPLHLAVWSGDVDTVQVLFDAGAGRYCINDLGESALQMAASHGDVKVVKVLLEADADRVYIDRFGNPALQIAVEGGHVEVVQVLLDAGADRYCINGEGKSVLEIAADKRRSKIIQVLLEADADRVYIHRFGQSALKIAVEEGYVEIVQLLLDAGADQF